MYFLLKTLCPTNQPGVRIYIPSIKRGTATITFKQMQVKKPRQKNIFDVRRKRVCFRWNLLLQSTTNSLTFGGISVDPFDVGESFLSRRNQSGPAFLQSKYGKSVILRYVIDDLSCFPTILQLKRLIVVAVRDVKSLRGCFLILIQWESYIAQFIEYFPVFQLQSGLQYKKFADIRQQIMS